MRLNLFAIGSHTALKSGMVAAESIYPHLTANPEHIVCETYEINEEEVSLKSKQSEACSIYHYDQFSFATL